MQRKKIATASRLNGYGAEKGRRRASVSEVNGHAPEKSRLNSQFVHLFILFTGERTPNHGIFMPCRGLEDPSESERVWGGLRKSKQFVDDVTRIGITSNISEESMKEVGKIFDDHYKLLLDFRKELSEELRFRIDDFLDREKETAGNFVTETQNQLANFNEDLSRTLSHSGFWCTSKVFAWLLGIFGFCLFVTIMTIALLIAGNLQFRVY